MLKVFFWILLQSFKTPLSLDILFWSPFKATKIKRFLYKPNFMITNHILFFVSLIRITSFPPNSKLQNMGLKDIESSGSFPTGKTAQENGLNYVPNAYVIPAPHRPSLSPENAIVPIIDMASLTSNNSAQRSLAMEELRKACINPGFFHVKFQATYLSFLF